MENRVEEKKKWRNFGKMKNLDLSPPGIKIGWSFFGRSWRLHFRRTFFESFSFIMKLSLLSFNSLRLRQFMKKHEIEKNFFFFFRETLFSTLPLLKIQKFFLLARLSAWLLDSHWISRNKNFLKCSLIFVFRNICILKETFGKLLFLSYNVSQIFLSKF